MQYYFKLNGKVPSKKNRYKPRKSGSGKAFYKDDTLQTQINALAWQIPQELKGLKLIHPKIKVRFDVPRSGMAGDRDNKYTTLLDILVTSNVLLDDSIRACNGKHEILESEIGSDYITHVWIEPKD